MQEISVEFWGDFACFSEAFAKVERLSYPFPNPSAARGMLSAIYCKPREFYWQVTRIEVLNPIRYVSFKRNEIKCTVSTRPVSADDERTQRQTVALRDVHYRISAQIVPRKEFIGRGTQLYEQALRRIRGGKCYYMPSGGLKEFVLYFGEANYEKSPIPEDLDAGLMVYDVFTPDDIEVQKKTSPHLSLFHAKMEQGVIEVPPYESPLVLKGGSSC